MIKLSGLHLLLTYQCTFECDHCFVWGSPWQSGTMSIANIQKILKEAKKAGSVEWIYFEGGEPFLYYQTMLAGINQAVAMGFKVGIVTNTYWATSDEDALLYLEPLTEIIQNLTISSDLFHFSNKISPQSESIVRVAEQLGISVGTICIERPEINAQPSIGQIPPASSSIMFRGRAAEKLAPKMPQFPASQFANCPHEVLADPGRVHVDPLGNLHICQGISLGNIFTTNLSTICEEYDASTHPIVGALLEGGPYYLAQKYGAPASGTYADACHLCYETRRYLRKQFPDILKPDQMYGVFS